MGPSCCAPTQSSENLALLALDLFLGRDCSAPWTLTRACVGVRALTANRQIAAMTNAAIGLDFDQPANIHLDLFAEIAFDAAFLLDGLAKFVDFVFGEVADLFRKIHAYLFRELLCSNLSETMNRRQPGSKPL